MENYRAEKKTCTEKRYKTHYRHVEKKLDNIQVIYGTHIPHTREYRITRKYVVQHRFKARMTKLLDLMRSRHKLQTLNKF
jgi:hypothetical protein